MSSKRNGGASNLVSSSEEDEGGHETAIRKSKRRKSDPEPIKFEIHFSERLTSSNKKENKYTTVIALDENKTEKEIRDILITEFPQLRGKR